MSEKKRVKDLLGQDLAGYKLTECYYLELKHGLMGTFPAIYNDGTGDVILTPDIEVIQEVEKKLEDRPHKMGSILCLVSSGDENAHAFSLAASEILEGKRIRILTWQGYVMLEAATGTNPFKWAPGLIG